MSEAVLVAVIGAAATLLAAWIQQKRKAGRKAARWRAQVGPVAYASSALMRSRFSFSAGAGRRALSSRGRGQSSIVIGTKSQKSLKLVVATLSGSRWGFEPAPT
jgi:hypothetical protein